LNFVVEVLLPLLVVVVHS